MIIICSHTIVPPEIMTSSPKKRVDVIVHCGFSSIYAYQVLQAIIMKTTMTPTTNVNGPCHMPTVALTLQ